MKLKAIFNDLYKNHYYQSASTSLRLIKNRMSENDIPDSWKMITGY